jgi:hypothetical protein
MILYPMIESSIYTARKMLSRSPNFILKVESKGFDRLLLLNFVKETTYEY